MSTVVPPTPPAAATPATPTPPMVTVPNPPPDMARLAVGTRIEATVAGGSAPGTLRLETAFGAVTVPTGLTLPPGTTLQLQVQALVPLLGLMIATVNGRPALAGLRALAALAGSVAATRAPAGPAGPPGAAGPLATQPPAAGRTVSAILIRAFPYTPESSA